MLPPSLMLQLLALPYDITIMLPPLRTEQSKAEEYCETVILPPELTWALDANP